MRRWDTVLTRYGEEMTGRGLSSEFVRKSIRECERLGVWLRRRKPAPVLEDIDFQVLVGYLKARSRFRAKGTIASIVTGLRGLGEYLVREKIWRKNVARWLKGPKIDGRSRVPRRMSQESLQGLLKTAGQSHVQYHRHLWTTLLVVLYATGLRRGELGRLDLRDWNGTEGTLRIDGRKTGEERAIPVSESVWRCIEAYLPWRHNALEKAGAITETALFVNRFGRRIRGENVGTALHKLARRAGVPLVTLHQFRHTCASDLIESGVTLPFVQKMLGHACVQSTMRYLAIGDPERRRAIEKHPINEILAQCGGQP